MTDTSNVIALDARHPADQPSARERLEESSERSWGERPPGSQTPDEQSVKVSQKETPPSVRTIARSQGIDLRPLLGILELQRPAGSTTEDMFVTGVIGQLEGVQVDGYSNYYLTIGENPNIMWSCHTDTVAKDDGRQNIKWDGDFLVLNEPKVGQCLGADDGAGLWLLLEMIKAKVPGLYIFHREEEIGGRGSHWIAEKNPELVKDIKMAIAFDRRDVDSVITHQGGQRTCSAKFANAMCEKLNQVEGLKYSLDSGGSFTDTKSYVDLIPECTNISVGYYSEHSTREKLDVAHLLRLREALISYDFSDLPIERDHTITEYDDDYGYGSMYGGWGSTRGQRYGSTLGRPKKPEPKTPIDGLRAIIEERSYSVAKMLYNMGMDPIDLEDCLHKMWQREVATPTPSPSPTYAKQQEEDWRKLVSDYLSRTGQDEAEDEDETTTQEMMWCDDCGEWQDPDYVFDSSGECPNCFGKNTEMIEVEVDLATGDVVQ